MHSVHTFHDAVHHFLRSGIADHPCHARMYGTRWYNLEITSTWAILPADCMYSPSLSTCACRHGWRKRSALSHPTPSHGNRTCQHAPSQTKFTAAALLEGGSQYAAHRKQTIPQCHIKLFAVADVPGTVMHRMPAEACYELMQRANRAKVSPTARREYLWRTWLAKKVQPPL